MFIHIYKEQDMAKIEDIGFRIRSYGRTELAVAYNPGLTPGGAWKRLVQWIKHSPGLEQHLEQLSGGKQGRPYTPAQVEAIVNALGEP